MRSSGWPILPWGMSEVHCFLRAGLSSRIFWVLRGVGKGGQRVSGDVRQHETNREATYRAVNIYPGEMQLTRMFA